MNILILGYGVEGKSVENYFKHDPAVYEHTSIDILDHFDKEELLFKDFSGYDLIFRTPSIPPKFIDADPKKVTSCTKYFFHHCPCPIIGITGTKGKGTTCTMTRDLIKNITNKHTYLVGNIGTAALDVLPDLTKNNIVIYEMSSFQLWDMDASPAISVVLRLEPDHLDVHESFAEYLSAKQNIVNYQSADDFCIYFKDNADTVSLAARSQGQKLTYPYTGDRQPLDTLLDQLQVPGAHNREDAEAALLATFAYFQKYHAYHKSFDDFLHDFNEPISTALHNFQALPHHIELVRELNSIKYYDDSFSTVSPALRACLNSFTGTPFVLIAGGKDKGFDLYDVKRMIFDNPHLIKAVLIGETADKLADGEDPAKYFKAGTDFELAIKTAQCLAETHLQQAEANSDTCLVDKKPAIIPPVVLLSPCASSFDMFKSYKDRGDQFKAIVNNL